MSSAADVSSSSERCWGTIGVSGDRSCPELERVVHCRNCPVLLRAAEELFAERAASGEHTAWLEGLALAPEPAEPTTSVVIFRLAEQWLALDTSSLEEIAAMRPVHAMPHRAHTALRGLVNIRGELHLCVRLEELLEIPERPAERGSRLVVLRLRGETWVFRADEVHGVHVFRTATSQETPPGTAPAVTSIVRGIFPWDGRSVGHLHPDWLAAALRRAIA